MPPRHPLPKSALLHDRNQMLIRMNNEAKGYRSIKSIVLGKAKIMSFEDIEVARAARAAKEVIKAKADVVGSVRVLRKSQIT